MSAVRGFATLALALGFALAAAAAPNLLGPTGLLFVPTAETLQEDEYNIALFKVEGEGVAAYAFNFGVRNNLEAGFSRLPDKNTNINLKYNFTPIEGNRAGISVGVLDATNQVDSTLYAVVTREFNTDSLHGITNLRASAGLASGDEDKNRPLNDLFAGLSFDIKRFTALIEHDGENFNAGGRFSLGKGILIYAASAGDDHDFVYGASYSSRF